MSPNVTHGGRLVMVCGCMTAAGVDKLDFIDEIMDHNVDLNISSQIKEIRNYITFKFY